MSSENWRPIGRWELGRHDVHVYQVSLLRQEDELHWLSSLLSEEEQQRVIAKVQPSHRAEAVASRGMLRWILGRYLNNRPERLRFTAGPCGKPALLPESAPIRFNVSHSDGLALVAVAYDREVGVNIERVFPLPLKDLAGELIWTSAERAQMDALSPEARLQAFYVGWVRKEACLKAMGIGLVQGLKLIEVSLLKDDPRPIRRICGLVENGTRWCVASLDPSPVHVAAAAVQSQHCCLHKFEVPDRLPF